MKSIGWFVILITCAADPGNSVARIDGSATFYAVVQVNSGYG
jgi:hypothetical protein